TTDGGDSWEPIKKIHDPGPNAQTINNIVAVPPSGTLFDFFIEISPNAGTRIGFVRSFDKGATFNGARYATTIATVFGSITPDTQELVRDASISYGRMCASAQSTRWHSRCRPMAGFRGAIRRGSTRRRGTTQTFSVSRRYCRRLRSQPAASSSPPTMTIASTPITAKSLLMTGRSSATRASLIVETLPTGASSCA